MIGSLAAEGHRQIALTMAVVLIALPVVSVGCAKTNPPVVKASGTVTLNGKPLPKVRLEFTPTFTGFGGELLAMAEAGEDGGFQFANGLGDGICVGSYKVTVYELPPPEELQEYRPDTPARQRAYFASLANRPIPEKYGSLALTPLRVEIEAGKTEYQISLDR